jgi:TBC1 domain family member 5
VLYIVNAESTWGQFFRNAELEKMLNQDLSRLYPELGDFFQTSTCQSMLGRILLVWSLWYPEFGYRQGKSFFSYLIIMPFVSQTNG